MGGAGTTPQRGVWRLPGAAILGLLAATPAALAQLAPEAPGTAGLPGATPLENPFPTTPSTTEAPNFQYESNLGPAMGALPSIGWTYVPRLSVYEEYNDNIFETQNDRRYDFITLISPGIAVTGDTPRLTLRLNYNPIFRIYARTPAQNSVGQQALGVANAILIPDEFYVNARVFADQVPLNGGFGALNFGTPAVGTTGFGAFGGGAATTLNRNNLTQIESAGLTPYTVQRFGDTGTLRAGLNLTQTYTSNSNGARLNSPAGPALHTETGEAIASFETGPDFGRFLNITTLDGEISAGNGVQSSSTRAILDNRLGYAFSRAILVFGDLGVETLQFPNSSPPVFITDGVWGIGTSLRPNTDSQVTMEYGHFSGATSFRALGTYAVTARTTITATYTVGIATDLQQIATQLAAITVNPQGNPVNLDTGAPASVINYINGINNFVSNNKTLVVTALTLLDRDTISVNFEREVESPLASARGAVPNVPNTTLTATASERHEISDRMSVTASVEGGTRSLQTFPTSESEQYYGATVTLRYLFSEKLTGYATYSYFDRTSNVPGVPFYNNIVLVGLTRTF